MSNSKKGFASMDPELHKAIAAKGGVASAKSDTSKRGFASMSPEKHAEISRLGGLKSSVIRTIRNKQ